MPVRAAAVLLTLLVLAALPASALAAPTRTWNARLFASGDGSSIRLTTIAADGAAAGGKFLTDGTPKAVYFNRKRLVSLSGRLGVVSSITSLNDRHQAAGYASSNPAARVANLFGSSTDRSLMPRAFFLSGRKVRRLSVPSAAFGVNISGEVAGTFLAKDGRLHGFLWRPASRARRLKKFIDLGVGDARALSDPPPIRFRRGRRSATAARALPNLMTIVGGNSVWLLNPVTGALKRRELAAEIFLQAVSNTGLASGGQDHSDGTRSPMVYDVGRGVLRMPTLPSDQTSGFAGGISDSTGLTSGSTSTDTSQHGMVWNADGSVLYDPNELPGVDLPPGTEITNTPAVTDTGLLAGLATTPTGVQDGVIVQPPPRAKEPLLIKAFDVYVDSHGSGGSGEDVRRFRKLIHDAVVSYGQSHLRTACRTLRDAAESLKDISSANFDEQFDALYDNGVSRGQAQDVALPAIAINIRVLVVELGAEMDCKGLREQLGI
ncbi:MAG: hypothetical protein QOE69_3213 [Thermoleophilaceae bacterium]|nr:hypothetical protein [Thermoleophilaceae bacterium]